jgi:hypothetical protein
MPQAQAASVQVASIEVMDATDPIQLRMADLEKERRGQWLFWSRGINQQEELTEKRERRSGQPWRLNPLSLQPGRLG